MYVCRVLIQKHHKVMQNYELTDYDYFRFGQQFVAIQSMASVTDEPFYVEAQDNYKRSWAMGMDAYHELFITHDRTDLMFPLPSHMDFRAYKVISDAAQVYGEPQKETFGAKFDNYVD